MAAPGGAGAGLPPHVGGAGPGPGAAAAAAGAAAGAAGPGPAAAAAGAAAAGAAAAPIFPDHVLGGRRLIENPELAGHVALERDFAIMFRELCHVMTLPDGDPRKGAMVAMIGAQADTALEAADNLERTATKVRAPRSMTRVPAVPWGAMDNLERVRSQHIQKFTGDEGGSDEVYSWLQNCMTTAASYRLTFEAAILLLLQTSTGSAHAYITDMIDVGKSLHEIVQCLEIRNGELCSPDEARIRLQAYQPPAGQSVKKTVDYLRKMARQAVINEENPVVRNAQKEILIRDNLLRTLPFSIKQTFEERLRQSQLLGGAPLTVSDIETDLMVLEKARNDRVQYAKSKDPKYKGTKNVRAVNEDFNLDQFDEARAELTDAEDTADEIEDPHEFFICSAAEVREGFRGKKQNAPKEKVLKGAVKRYNQKFHGKKVAGVSQANIPGPPAYLDAEERKKSIRELLKQANCEYGQCIQCGFRGHIMGRDACTLKDKPLADRFCSRCEHGLHTPDDCVKPISAKANQAAENPLNED